MLTFILGSVCAIAAVSFSSWMWHRFPFHIIVFFALFAVVDVFFPAAYWSLYGQVNNPSWLTPLDLSELAVGLSFYSLFLAIFAFFAVTIGGDLRSDQTPSLFNSDVEHRLMLLLIAFLSFTVIKMILEMFAFGGVYSWFMSRLIISSLSETEGSTGILYVILAKLPVREVFQALVGVGFYFRRQSRFRIALTYFFPLVAITFALLTFLRGSVLTCLFVLIFAEYLRRRGEPKRHLKVGIGRSLAPMILALVLGFVTVYAFGAVRDKFRELASGKSEVQTESLVILPTFLTAGHGLLGVSHILLNYDQAIPKLGGKTYVDMLLLPVPRFIYKSKPAWYGVDDITKGMGWPPTTQFAVTMPGEAFANFGVLGLLMAAPMGAIFGLLQRFMVENVARHLLLAPVVLFQMASTTNWMSFTGFMNSLPLVVFLSILAYLILGFPKLTKQGRLETGQPKGGLTPGQDSRSI